MERIHGICCNIVYFMSEKDSIPLVDNGFKIIPKIQMSTHGQLIAMFAGGILLGLLKLIIKMDGNNYSFAVIFSRYAVICSIAIVCRVMSFLSTILPSPHVHCHNEDFNPPTGWGIITHLNLAKGCGDLIFSSHVMHFLCVLSVVVWYILPSYDEMKVMKLMDQIRDLKNRLSQSAQPLQIKELKNKIDRISKMQIKSYRNDMIQSAQKMRSFNWRWALIAFLPFFTLLFLVLVISSRGHYTIDVLVSLYFIPFMSYFVNHQWKEEIGKALQERVSSFYPKLCKNYVQILNNEDLAIRNQQNITSQDTPLDLQKLNGNELVSLELIDINQKKFKLNGDATQPSTAVSSLKYEPLSQSFGTAIELAIRSKSSFFDHDQQGSGIQFET